MKTPSASSDEDEPDRERANEQQHAVVTAPFDSLRDRSTRRQIGARSSTRRGRTRFRRRRRRRGRRQQVQDAQQLIRFEQARTTVSVRSIEPFLNRRGTRNAAACRWPGQSGADRPQLARRRRRAIAHRHDAGGERDARARTRGSAVKASRPRTAGMREEVAVLASGSAGERRSAAPTRPAVSATITTPIVSRAGDVEAGPRAAARARSPRPGARARTARGARNAPSHGEPYSTRIVGRQRALARSDSRGRWCRRPADRRWRRPPTAARRSACGSRRSCRRTRRRRPRTPAWRRSRLRHVFVGERRAEQRLGRRRAAGTPATRARRARRCRSATLVGLELRRTPSRRRDDLGGRHRRDVADEHFGEARHAQHRRDRGLRRVDRPGSRRRSVASCLRNFTSTPMPAELRKLTFEQSSADPMVALAAIASRARASRWSAQ